MILPKTANPGLNNISASRRICLNHCELQTCDNSVKATWLTNQASFARLQAGISRNPVQVTISHSIKEIPMQNLSNIGLPDVQTVYSGPEGQLWELIMGEQIHIGGFQSSMDLAQQAGIGAGHVGS